jgi:flagellar assembly protein FliH
MAGVIKAGAPLPSQSGGPATAYPLDDIGQTYVARVRGEASVVANKLLADAKEEAAKIKGQAADEGRKAALAAVEQTLRTKLDGQLKTAAAALDQVVKQVQQARDAYLRAWEDQALSLALAIAERVIRREVAARPEITLTSCVKRSNSPAAKSESPFASAPKITQRSAPRPPICFARSLRCRAPH